MLCTPDQNELVEAIVPGKLRMRASLQLVFARDDSTTRTTVIRSRQDPPLRVVRTFDADGHSALAHLHNVSGGVFGGDDLSLQVEVGEGANVQLTTTGATRVYRRSAESASARQHCSFTVSEGALLEYVPDAIIPFAGAHFHQSTTVQLSADAGLFWWEILAPGREASNEVFAFECVEMHTQLSAPDELISVDRVRLEPGKKAIGAIGRLGSYRYWSTFYICKVGVATDFWLDLEQQLRRIAADLPSIDKALWGISTLKAHGLMIRCLAKHGSDVTSGLFCLWDAAKFALYGRHAVRPRKTH